MKTHLAVYEDGLFDLRGGKVFLRGGKCPLSPPPPKRNPDMTLIGVHKMHGQN